MKLLRRFDVELLQRDLAACDARWTGRGNGVGWSALSLRSASGDAGDVWQGRAGEPVHDTALLKASPYFQYVIAEINQVAPVGSVRLSAVAPGGYITQHADVDLPDRVHVPIVTAPGATITLGGTTVSWPAGEAWRADFGQLHSVHNVSLVRRVHLLLLLG